MIVKNLSHTEISESDISFFKSKIPHPTNQYGFNASDFGLDKRIICLMDDDDLPIIMVNPVIETNSDEREQIVYFEFDNFIDNSKLTKKQKNIRKTVRLRNIKVSTDNIGTLEFSADSEKWESIQELMNDKGLVKCVAVQRLIDSLNGIGINDVKYSQTVINKQTYGRNERIMLKSTDGKVMYVKYKNSEEYIKKGYEII